MLLGRNPNNQMSNKTQFYTTPNAVLKMQCAYINRMWFHFISYICTSTTRNGVPKNALKSCYQYLCVCAYKYLYLKAFIRRIVESRRVWWKISISNIDLNISNMIQRGWSKNTTHIRCMYARDSYLSLFSSMNINNEPWCMNDKINNLLKVVFIANAQEQQQMMAVFSCIHFRTCVCLA